MRHTVLLAVASAVVLVAACGGKDKDPTAPPVSPLVGRYALATINGQPLPFTFRPDTFMSSWDEDMVIYSERWDKDEYDLKANSRFARAFRMEIHTRFAGAKFPQEPELRDYVVLGRWETAGSQVRLTTDSIVGVVYNDRMRLQFPDTLFVSIAAPADLTRGSVRGHRSLGPEPVVFSNYTLLYKRQ